MACCNCCPCKTFCSQMWGICKGGVLILIFQVVGWFLFTYVEENTNPIHCFMNSNKILAQTYLAQAKEKERATLFFYRLQNKTNLALSGQQAIAMYSAFEKHFNVPKPSLAPDAFTVCTKWYRFSVMTITTIGFGAVTPKTNIGKLLLIPYALIGIPLMMAFLAYIGSIISDWIERIMTCIHKIIKGNTPIRFKSLKRSFYLFISMWIIILLAMLDFIFLHTLSWLDGIYFYIVTFTTVGFGDIVWPALHPSFYSLKLFIGLSIVSGLVDSILDLREKLERDDKRCELFFCPCRKSRDQDSSNEENEEGDENDISIQCNDHIQGTKF